MSKSCISKAFIRFARDRFRLAWEGIHGAPHWSRVRHNGLLLAKHYTVDTEVVQWFSFIHDLERRDDHLDPGHGPRAAVLAKAINDEFMRLDADQLATLQAACAGHSEGSTVAEATVMVCWDADRLDLARVGIDPHPDYLCTALARRRDTIEQAVIRSCPVDWPDASLELDDPSDVLFGSSQ